jgi:hypothetical protein
MYTPNPNIINLDIYETKDVVKLSAFSGISSARFRVRRGSRIVFSVVTTAISSGSLAVTIDNSGDGENWLEVLNFSTGTASIQQKIYSDFHPDFRIRYTATGTVDFKVIVTIHDNSASTFIENANLNVDVDHTQGDSVQVGDGTDVLQINDDGSINVQDVTINNPVHDNYVLDIDTSADGYGFKAIGAYSSLNNFTKIKALYIHSESSSQVRILVDGVEIRRQDVDPHTSTAIINFSVPYPLLQAQVISIEARVNSIINGVINFRSAVEGFIAS